MTAWTARHVSAAGVVLGSLLFASTAFAEKHRVAAVDPDEQLARALDVALSPWGADVTLVTVEHPGAMVTLSVDRARAIAKDTHADVVMWVSPSDDRSAAWIYDVASDQASLRELSSAPPFDATTAAGVALSVKALLRFTVVAPPPERFGAPLPAEPTWAFGLSAILAAHFGQDVKPELRSELSGAYWPAWLDHRFGAMLSFSYGQGVQFQTSTVSMNTPNEFDGTLSDFSARAAVGARFPLRPWLAFEATLGASVHMLVLDYTSGPVGPVPGMPDMQFSQGNRQSTQHFTAAVEPRVALDFSLLNGFLRLAPWIGMEVLQRPHVFFSKSDQTDPLAEAARVTTQVALRAQFVLP